MSGGFRRDRLLQNPPKLTCKGSNDVYFAELFTAVGGSVQ